MEVVAKRIFDMNYIWFDCAFLVIFAALLIFRKKYATLTVGFLAGILYMIVDYGIFHLATGSRHIVGGDLFWVLLWMSMSYGFTNFTWIWLWISKDKHLFEWTVLILSWWLCCPLLTQTFPSGHEIQIWRETGAYHGYMAIILFVGYLLLIAWNLFQKKNEYKVQIPWLLAIGLLVQFGWEVGLFIGGIRSADFTSAKDILAPMIVNSLLETNLGMPYIFIIFIAVSRRFTEKFTRREKKLSFCERIAESNKEKVSDKENVSEYLA